MFTCLHASLINHGYGEQARKLLRLHHKHFDFLEVTKNIKEDELFDEELIMIYQQAFTDLEKQRKRVILEQNLADSHRQKLILDEHLKATNVCFVVSEDTKCS